VKLLIMYGRRVMYPRRTVPVETTEALSKDRTRHSLAKFEEQSLYEVQVEVAAKEVMVVP
jgi:hypothetical protein